MDLPELWTAVLSGQYELANQMIYSGANINETKKTKIDSVTTLLHYAIARKSDVRCINMLANLGANVNARDSQNLTPLHWAVKYVRPDIIEVLINERAVVDARDNDQLTPLHHCAMKKNNCIESTEKLIAGGASIHAISARGFSVLHMAIMWRNLKMVKILIANRVITDAKDDFGCTPLLFYFKNFERQTEILQLLLDNGADVNSKSDDTSFPLFLAAHYNLLAPVHLLLKRGARINEATDTGYTALHVACKKGLADVTALLLKFGADLNMRNWKGETPFELLPNSQSSEATAQVVIREAVKRVALGQSFCEGYKQMAQLCETYSKFEQESREEIKRMQSETIDIEDSAISFFYIFSIDEKMLAALARKETIVTAFESSSYKALFRIYAGELTTKFEVAKKHTNLPAPIMRKISAYIKYGYIIENVL